MHKGAVLRFRARSFIVLQTRGVGPFLTPPLLHALADNVSCSWVFSKWDGDFQEGSD